jgi:hypothetical protein
VLPPWSSNGVGVLPPPPRACSLSIPLAAYSAEQAQLVKDENNLRELFATNPTAPQLNDPHVMLTDVYGNYDEFQYQDETPEEVRACREAIVSAVRRVAVVRLRRPPSRSC